MLRHAESATVRLLMGSPAEATTGGSGTLISPTGLILTGSDVARPDTPGFAPSACTAIGGAAGQSAAQSDSIAGPSGPGVRGQYG